MPRFALRDNVSESVALLFAGAGSVTLPRTDTVAVLPRLPRGAAKIVEGAGKVTLPPLGRPTVLLMLPEPDAVHVPPPAPTHVHEQVSEAGNVSTTVEPGALLGPGLDAVIV